MSKKYDILVINRDNVLGAIFDVKGTLIRVKKYEEVKRLDFRKIWEELSADFYGLDCVLRMQTTDKIELSKFLKEFFNYKFNIQ